MTKLTYEDKVNIYNDRKIGLSIKSIANKYSMTNKNIQYMLCLAEKHGIDILKKEKKSAIMVTHDLAEGISQIDMTFYS